jgi:GTP cyclohydrolase I
MAKKTALKNLPKKTSIKKPIPDFTENAVEVVFNTPDVLKHVRPTPSIQNSYSSEEKVELIAEHFTEIMKILGLDLKNSSLKNTPRRVAQMYVRELFAGLDARTFPRVTVIENDMCYDQTIVVKDISVLSTCEHHFVTIEGKASIAYIPQRRVIGLSKLNRIAKFFSRRPQVQERLTKQIADCLSYVLETEDVAVVINARHFCVISRGVEDVGSTTITTDLRGAFKDDPRTRMEFLIHCQKK